MSVVVEAVRDLGSFFSHLFDTSGFPPRWHCGTWSDAHGWLHILSDLGVWSAYLAIPCVLWFFVLRRSNLPFRFMFVLFGAFILFCGTTHLIEAMIFWWPAYRLAGLVKFATAVISWATVAALIPLAPRVLTMKSPDELERTVAERTAELQHEIAERKRAESALLEQREMLEVTLASIGDAVVATDTETRVTFFNSIAEQLTGWPAAEALGKPLDEVFRIINEQSRLPVETPCEKVLREGRIIGLANHTLLIARDGKETPIDDSAAPIRDRQGNISGVVLVFRDASKQRAYVEAQEQLASIVQNSQDAIISEDLDGTIRSWNAAAQNLFGYTAEEALGHSIEMLVPTELHGEFVEAIECLHRGEPVEYLDTVRLHKNGTRIEVSSRLSPIRDASGEVTGVSKISHDIATRKRSERVLKLFSETGTVLSALMETRTMLDRVAHLAVPAFADWCTVHLVSDQGKIEAVAHAHSDPALQAVLEQSIRDYPPDWNQSSVIANTLRSGLADLISEVPASLLASVARDAEHRRLLNALDPRSAITVPIIVRQQVIGAMQFVNSSGNRRFTSDDASVAVELARRAAVAIDNSRLYDNLKVAERQKDDFLAMLAHELRNPLAAIQYANQLAAASNLSESSYSETINRQVKNLSHLIDDLLDVSRITRDKIQLKIEAVDGGTLMERAVASVRPQIDARQHKLVVEIPPGPLPLDVDPTRVEQILVNLLSNAAKYTPEKGTITIRAFEQDGNVLFQVRDTGMGINREMLPRVFDLFTQVDKSLDRSQGGLGIGLTVVRKLAEMHGGAVWADSPGLGQGSEFTVRLPLGVLAKKSEAPVAQAGNKAESLKILVVDDNVDTAQGMAMLLKIAGHQVTMAHDGHAALAAARAGKPQVLLLDIGLPGLDGYHVARTLRQEGAFAHARMVAISGYGQPEDRKRSLEAGFDEHLVKPVTYEQLLAALGQ